MADTPRIFVSFSVSDDMPGRDFVRQLIAKLNAQAMEAWVYESPAGRIPAGASIAETCRQRIEACDLFVVCISDRALRSEYVAMETSHALWVSEQRELHIYPIVSTATPREHWPHAIAKATGYRGRQIEHGNLEGLDAIVLDLCLRLDVDYQPPKPRVVRLPLARRLSEELKARTAGGAGDMGDFAQLLKRCDIAVEQLERGDHELAWSYVNALLLDLRLMYDLPNAYYPRVFLGATLLAKANDGRGGFEEAEQWFARLIAEGHPLLDANAHAGRGNALLAMGSYEEAIGCFWAAANCLSAPDPALLYNIVRAHVMADIEIDEAQLRARSVTIEDGLATRQPGDLSRMAAVQMLSHAYRGDWAQAQHAWREVADAEDVFPELIVDTCHCFIRHARGHPESRHLKTALAILKAFRQGTASSSDAAFCMLEHTEARLHRDMGDARHAGLLIARLVSSYPTSPVLAVDAAMFALECGDLLSVQRFASHAAHLRKAEASRPPVSAEQFEFAVGQAFWLLGREPEARECFRRSGLPASKWFAQSMPGLRAAAVQETPTWPRLFGPGDR